MTAILTSTRLGERTCVVSVPAPLDAPAARRLEDGVNEALADGYCDFVLDFTAVRGCRDRRPTPALARLAHQLVAHGCAVVVAARHVDLLTFLDSVPSWSKLPLALEREEALALLLERPVDA
ncbi:MAG: hypothetical protein QOH46_154 [Solirubrobacteraceae bacterium]|nr:hypothetical protein [Solirubrobacteraceae bacterium]